MHGCLMVSIPAWAEGIKIDIKEFMFAPVFEQAAGQLAGKCRLAKLDQVGRAERGQGHG